MWAGEKTLILFYYKHFVNIRKLFESYPNKLLDIYKTFLVLPFIWQTNVAHEINPTWRGFFGSLPQHWAAASPDPAVTVKASSNSNISFKFLNSDCKKVLEYGKGVCMTSLHDYFLISKSNLLAYFKNKDLISTLKKSGKKKIWSITIKNYK